MNTVLCGVFTVFIREANMTLATRASSFIIHFVRNGINLPFQGLRIGKGNVGNNKSPATLIDKLTCYSLIYEKFVTDPMLRISMMMYSYTTMFRTVSTRYEVHDY